MKETAIPIKMKRLKRMLISAWTVCFFGFMAATVSVAQSTEKQVTADAANFHRFRIAALARATEIHRQNPESNDGVNYLAVECKNLAHRTSPQYLYGIVEDLIQDTSQTEEPYLIAIMVLDNYPPDDARAVVRKIIASPKYSACGDVKNWLWEIDEAQKGREKGKAD